MATRGTFSHGHRQIVADTSREQRVTSAMLAVLCSVEEFGKHMLQMVGAPVTKTSRIECFTEVVFKGAPSDPRMRPDGLVLVTLGSRRWSAIVEAKMGAAELTEDQVETYLDIARQFKVDAVITVSNQFSPLPTHHPLAVDKRKTRHVGLYHWSWTSVLSEARLLAEHKGVSDPDQAYVLQELIRYLMHPSSGVLSFTRMGPDWKNLCEAVQHDSPLARNSSQVTESVGDWHQLLRFVALRMSLIVGRAVTVSMSRAQADDPANYLNDAIGQLLRSRSLDGEFAIPDAASRLRLCADLNRRTLTASMRLKAPTDRVRASSLVTWALGQAGKCEDPELLIRAIWPGRAPDTTASLGRLREDRNALLNSGLSSLPLAFEFSRVRDLAGQFKGSSKFVEHAVDTVPRFYADVGQHLKTWIPPAPKVTKEAAVVDEAVTPAKVDRPPVGKETTEKPLTPSERTTTDNTS